MRKIYRAFILSVIISTALILTAAANSLWDGSISSSLEGDGTKASPYLVSDGADLAYLSLLSKSDIFEGLYFSLTDDITLNGKDAFGTDDGGKMTVSDKANFLSPIGTSEYPFSGVFLGGGHYISGMVTDKAVPFSGLFGYLSGAEVSDLFVSGGYVECTSYAGLLCGKVADGTYIHNVTVSGTIVGQSEALSCYAGGVAGTLSADSTMEACASYADVYGSKAFSSYVGGIVGINYGEISFCTFGGVADGVSSYFLCTTGGIAGDNKGTVAYCRNDGKITTSTSTLLTDCYAGGIAGQNSAGEILDCTSDKASAVSTVNNSESYSVCGAGGIVGNNVDGSISASSNLGTVEGQSAYVGGIAAVNLSAKGESKISDCINSGVVSSLTGVTGGIVGTNSASEYVTNKAYILNCINTSDASGDTAGGITGCISESGSAKSVVENCITVSSSPDENGVSYTEAQLKAGSVPDGYGTAWVFESTKLPTLAFADGIAKMPSYIVCKDYQGVKYTGETVFPTAASETQLTFVGADKDMGEASCEIYGTENDEYFAPSPVFTNYIIINNPDETQIFSVKPTLKVNGNNASGKLTLSVYCPDAVKSASLVLTYSKATGFIGTRFATVTFDKPIATLELDIPTTPASDLSKSDMTIYLFGSMEKMNPLGDCFRSRFTDITSDSYIDVDGLFKD